MKKRLLSIALALFIALMVLPAMSFANSSYTEWTEETSLPTKAGAYKLTKDVTITNTVTIGAWSGSSATVTIDLNGHTVKLNGSSAQIYVQNTGTLIIEDSDPNSKGLITNDGSDNNNNQYLIQVKGNIIINGGTLESRLKVTDPLPTTIPTVLYLQGETAVGTLNNGTIINTWSRAGNVVYANKPTGTLKINGGKIENKAAGYSGDTPTIKGGKIIMTGGTIKTPGTGIDTNSTYPVEITGGTIEAGYFGIRTAYCNIKPAEGKTVNISAGRTLVRAYNADKGNKIYGGNFTAPKLMESSYAASFPNNVEIYGGLFNFDVSGYEAPGYIINHPVFVDDVEMYEVKQNRPHITGDSLKEDDELLGEIEIGFTEEIQEKLEEIFEQEIEKNEKIEEALLDGQRVNIHVQVERLEEEDINEEELKAIKEAVKDGNFAKFYDITLIVKANGQQIDTITSISNKLKFKVLIPEELLKDGRTFFMYRYHEGENGGEVEKLTGEVNEENYFVFETNRFSTYALAYEDKAGEPSEGGQGSAIQQPEEDKQEEPKVEKDETPKTGSVDIVLLVSAMIAVVSVAGIVMVKKYIR